MIKYLLLLLLLTLIVTIQYVPKINNIYNEYVGGYLFMVDLKNNQEIKLITKLSDDDKIELKWNISKWTLIKNFDFKDINWKACIQKSFINDFSWNTIYYKKLFHKNKTAKITLESENKNINAFLYTITPWVENTTDKSLEDVFKCENIILSKKNNALIKSNTINSDLYIWISWAKWINDWNFNLLVEIY